MYWKVRDVLSTALFFVGGAFISVPDARAGELGLEGDTPNILVLHSFHQTFVSTRNLNFGISDVFGAYDGRELFVFYEYLDAKRFPDPERQLQIFNEALARYEEGFFDAILVADDHAFEFLSEQRALVQDLPVVFCAINSPDNFIEKRFPQVAGIYEYTHIEENLRLIEALHPEVETIYGIADESMTGLAVRRRFPTASETVATSVDHLISPAYTPEALPEFLDTVGPRSAFLLMPAFNRPDGSTFLASELTEVIAAAGFPIYTGYEILTDPRVVGGAKISLREHGRIAANKILEFLDSDADAPPRILYEAPLTYAFDFRQLDKHGLALGDLPEGSVISNEPLFIWDAYPYLTFTAVSTTLFLALATVLLMRNVRQRAQSQELLEAKNQALQEKKDELVRANQAKAEFLDMMSHELRTPINGVLGPADMLRLELDQADQLELLEMIEGSANRLLAMVSDVLSYNALTHGKWEPFIEDIPLETLKFRTQIFRKMAERKGLVFKEEISKRVPEVISADPTALMQITMNLLSNAVRFTDDGYVSVSIDYADEILILKVADTGVGISPQAQERIFRVFEREDSSITRASEGAGVGLAATQALVKHFGGKISLSSTVGKGSVFLVFLPIRAPEVLDIVREKNWVI